MFQFYKLVVFIHVSTNMHVHLNVPSFCGMWQRNTNQLSLSCQNHGSDGVTFLYVLMHVFVCSEVYKYSGWIMYTVPVLTLRLAMQLQKHQRNQLYMKERQVCVLAYMHSCNNKIWYLNSVQYISSQLKIQFMYSIHVVSIRPYRVHVHVHTTL